MPNKMERFTQRARRVLSLAQEEAERLQHNYIGTEHLLLGLIREEGGVAGRVLRELGLEQRRVEELDHRRHEQQRAEPADRGDVELGFAGQERHHLPDERSADAIRDADDPEQPRGRMLGWIH